MSTIYTTLEKINIAKISQYLALNAISKGGLNGGGQDVRLPRKIYLVRKNVEWLYDLDTPVTAVGAIGYVTISFLGFNGDGIEIFATFSGSTTSLGTYEKLSTDTDISTLVASIAAAMDYEGFTFASNATQVIINAPASLGATVNGGSNLSIALTATTTAPYVELLSISSIATTSAIVNGSAIVQGGVTFFNNYGYCLSTSPNPDLSDTVFSYGAGSGTSALPVTGLLSGTLYYIRMYGTYNTTTTIFGVETSFTTL
jgi:hypothetical protein